MEYLQVPQGNVGQEHLLVAGFQLRDVRRVEHRRRQTQLLQVPDEHDQAGHDPGGEVWHELAQRRVLLDLATVLRILSTIAVYPLDSVRHSRAASAKVDRRLRHLGELPRPRQQHLQRLHQVEASLELRPAGVVLFPRHVCEEDLTGGGLRGHQTYLLSSPLSAVLADGCHDALNIPLRISRHGLCCRQRHVLPGEGGAGVHRRQLAGEGLLASPFVLPLSHLLGRRRLRLRDDPHLVALRDEFSHIGGGAVEGGDAGHHEVPVAVAGDVKDTRHHLRIGAEEAVAVSALHEEQQVRVTALQLGHLLLQRGQLLGNEGVLSSLCMVTVQIFEQRKLQGLAVLVPVAAFLLFGLPCVVVLLGLEFLECRGSPGASTIGGGTTNGLFILLIAVQHLPPLWLRRQHQRGGRLGLVRVLVLPVALSTEEAEDGLLRGGPPAGRGLGPGGRAGGVLLP